MKAGPLIAIGLPVYNGDKTLGQVLDSILAQTYRDFTLLISDNASTDDTQDICLEYAALDARIRYVRQARNIGADANFSYVFDNTLSEFYMWSAADDLRSPDFLELNLRFLQQHPDYLGSTCPVHFHGRRSEKVAMGDSSLDGDDPYQRVLSFFGGWHANGRFYSLFRRDAVEDWVRRHAPVLGADWSLITRVAIKGKLNRVDDGWVELGSEGVSNTTDIFAAHRFGVLDWLLPFRHLSRETWGLMEGATPAQRALMLARLAYLNGLAFATQFIVMSRRARPGKDWNHPSYPAQNG